MKNRQFKLTIARASAFTLIELLVVVAMVAVLASLLLPALTRGKAQAKSIQCRSNIRQLVLQLAIYVQDFNAYPSTDYVKTNLLGSAKGGSWLNVDMGPTPLTEKEEKGITRCPTRIYTPLLLEPLGSLTYGYTSYGYNRSGYSAAIKPTFQESLGLTAINAKGMYRPVRDSEVLVPSDMLALGDNLALLPRSAGGFPEDTVIESFGSLDRQEASAAGGFPIKEIVRRAAARHLNQGNVAFCDGHVEAMKFRRLFFDRDDASLARWNRDHEPHR